MDNEFMSILNYQAKLIRVQFGISSTVFERIRHQLLIIKICPRDSDYYVSSIFIAISTIYTKI